MKKSVAVLILAGSLVASPAVAQPATASFGFNGSVSGFPTGAVRITGGGAYNLDNEFVHSAGGFRCLESVEQGPLSVSINPDGPGKCLAGQGVRWDTVSLLSSTRFKCTGSATEALKTATTSDETVVLQADFYRTSDGNEESFTAQMIVSDTDIAPEFPGVNVWIQGVGCGTAIVNFRASLTRRPVYPTVNGRISAVFDSRRLHSEAPVTPRLFHLVANW